MQLIPEQHPNWFKQDSKKLKNKSHLINLPGIDTLLENIRSHIVSIDAAKRFCVWLLVTRKEKVHPGTARWEALMDQITNKACQLGYGVAAVATDYLPFSSAEDQNQIEHILKECFASHYTIFNVFHVLLYEINLTIQRHTNSLPSATKASFIKKYFEQLFDFSSSDTECLTGSPATHIQWNKVVIKLWRKMGEQGYGHLLTKPDTKSSEPKNSVFDLFSIFLEITEDRERFSDGLGAPARLKDRIAMAAELWSQPTDVVSCMMLFPRVQKILLQEFIRPWLQRQTAEEQLIFRTGLMLAAASPTSLDAMMTIWDLLDYDKNDTQIDVNLFLKRAIQRNYVPLVKTLQAFSDKKDLKLIQKWQAKGNPTPQDFLIMINLCSPSFLLEMINLRFIRKVHIQTVDDLGNTPLHYAASSNMPEHARLLLLCGANPTAANAQKKTSVDLTYNSVIRASLHMQAWELTTRELLRKQEWDITLKSASIFNYASLIWADGSLLMTAVELGKFSSVQRLVEEGFRIDLQNDEGENALTLAALGKHEEILGYLLSQSSKEILQEFSLTVQRRGLEISQDAHLFLGLTMEDDELADSWRRHDSPPRSTSYTRQGLWTGASAKAARQQPLPPSRARAEDDLASSWGPRNSSLPARPSGAIIIPTTGDGNCLFHALFGSFTRVCTRRGDRLKLYDSDHEVRRAKLAAAVLATPAERTYPLMQERVMQLIRQEHKKRASDDKTRQIKENSHPQLNSLLATYAKTEAEALLMAAINPAQIHEYVALVEASDQDSLSQGLRFYGLVLVSIQSIVHEETEQRKAGSTVTLLLRSPTEFPHLNALVKKHMDRDEVIEDARKELIQEIEKNSQLMDFIEKNYVKHPVGLKHDATLEDKYRHLLKNCKETFEKELISVGLDDSYQALERLSIETPLTGITSAHIREYSRIIGKPGRDLIAPEIELFAAVEGITIVYHQGDSNGLTPRVDTYNPGRARSIAVRHNGFNHVEGVGDPEDRLTKNKTPAREDAPSPSSSVSSSSSFFSADSVSSLDSQRRSQSPPRTTASVKRKLTDDERTAGDDEVLQQVKRSTIDRGGL